MRLYVKRLNKALPHKLVGILFLIYLQFYGMFERVLKVLYWLSEKTVKCVCTIAIVSQLSPGGCTMEELYMAFYRLPHVENCFSYYFASIWAL